MVMPCSRSASRPSVRSDRSSSAAPRRSDARSTAASWSSWIARASYSSRPMSVLLPSSTLPAVANLSGCINRDRPYFSHLEVPLLLPSLHGGFRRLVVHPRRAALGQPRNPGFFDDFFCIESIGFDRASAADISDRAEAHRDLFHRFPRPWRRNRRHRNEQAAATHDRTAMHVVDRGHVQALALDVLPDVELGPVADREHAHVLAGMHARVVQAPELGPLVARVPLAEFVAQREHALLGARLFLVAPRAADRGVEAELGDRLEQRHGLRRITTFLF